MTEIRVNVATADDELRRWADWHAAHRHDGVAAVLYAALDHIDPNPTTREKP